MTKYWKGRGNFPMIDFIIMNFHNRLSPSGWPTNWFSIIIDHQNTTTHYSVKHTTLSKTFLCQANTRTMFIYNVLLLSCRRHTSSGEDSKLSVMKYMSKCHLYNSYEILIDSSMKTKHTYTKSVNPNSDLIWKSKHVYIQSQRNLILTFWGPNMIYEVRETCF